MGTFNYMSGNTTVIYAVESDEDYVFGDVKHQLGVSFESLEEQYGYSYEYFKEDENIRNQNRSYPAVYIGALSHSVPIEHFYDEIHIALRVKAVAGYYSGFTLDYDYDFTTCCTVEDTIKEVLDVMFDEPEAYLLEKVIESLLHEDDDDEMLRVKLKKFVDDIGRDALEDKLNQEFNLLIERVETAFGDTSTKMKRVPGGYEEIEEVENAKS